VTDDPAAIVRPSVRPSIRSSTIVCVTSLVISDSFGSVDIAKCSGDVNSDKAMDAEVLSWQLFAYDISFAVVDGGFIDEVHCLEQENV
jgi:hypothetical protein